MKDVARIDGTEGIMGTWRDLCKTAMQWSQGNSSLCQDHRKASHLYAGQGKESSEEPNSDQVVLKCMKIRIGCVNVSKGIHYSRKRELH